MKKVLEVGFSGFLGVVLTLLVQYALDEPQTITFIYDGNEVVVTETEYVDLIEANKQLQEKLDLAQSDLKELQQQIENQNSEEKVQQTIHNATNYWNSGEYIQALTILKNSGIKSEDIEILYHSYSDEYCINLLGQVDNLISERRYDEAISILTESKGLVKDNQILQDKITNINSNKPIKLSDLKIAASRYFDLNSDKPVEDTVGNRYSTGNLFITKAEGDTGYGYATFYLGEKYTGLVGTIAVSDESENRSDTQLEGWIEVYSKKGNDYSQLYVSPMLSRMTSPVSIPEIDLSGAEWLEIRFYNNGNYFSLAGGYHSLRVIVADTMIYSD